LASSNGQGKNTNEPNSAQDGKDFIARGVVNIAELVENKDAIFHLGAGYTKGTGSVAGITGVLNNNASTARTEGRGLNFFTMTLPNGPTATAGAASFINGQEFDRERTGLEGVLAYNQFKLQTEWEKLNISGTSAPNNPGGALAYDRDIKAHYVTATWLITGEKYSNFYKDGAFGAIKPANNFKTTGVGIGAWEVGVRYSSFDAGDFNNAATNPAGTGQAAGLCNTPALLAAGTTAGTCLTNGADAWTYGLKWVPTPNFLLELNYVRTKFDTPVSVITGNVNGTTTSENAVTFRGGLTF
jgi:phosphate-selective porin OprO/OprP